MLPTIYDGSGVDGTQSILAAADIGTSADLIRQQRLYCRVSQTALGLEMLRPSLISGLSHCVLLSIAGAGMGW